MGTEHASLRLDSGLSGGNSGFLARECGWSGLMVDGHAEHMIQVGRRFPTVTAVASWVTRDNVNQLISQHGFTGEVDLFSLDLDGNDYWIWEAMTACSPRIVILEYNSMLVRIGRDESLRSGVRPAPPSHDLLRRVAFRAGEGGKVSEKATDSWRWNQPASTRSSSVTISPRTCPFASRRARSACSKKYD